MSSISNNYAKDCKVVFNVKSAGQTGELGNVKEVKEIHNIYIAGFKIEKHNFIIEDIADEHFNCDGILGADILFKNNLHLDFKKNIMEFTSRSITNGFDFKLIDNSKMLLDISINSHNVENFIFDTGATLLSIDKKLEKVLALKTIENRKGFEIKDSNGNNIDRITYIIDSLKFGKINRNSLLAYGFNFDHVNKLNKINENGILGKPFFDNQIFTFDFDSLKCKIQ